MNRHDRRRRLKTATLPGAARRLRPQDGFVAFASEDPEHRERLHAFQLRLAEAVDTLTWLDSTIVCLQTAALSALGPGACDIADGQWVGMDEKTFVENARRTYQQLAAQLRALPSPNSPADN